MGSMALSRDRFIECGWSYEADGSHYGYSSVMQSLQRVANENREAGKAENAEMLYLLARAASMMLSPESTNEPFKPFFQNYQEGTRSPIPEDFTIEELEFFEMILDLVTEPWLSARLADLLWLCKKPRNPKHARHAIEQYIAHPIDSKTWHRDVSRCRERAARLAMQINDRDKLEVIRSELLAAFNADYPDDILMPLWAAKLLSKLQLDRGFSESIAIRLTQLGLHKKTKGDFGVARLYLELAAKLHQKSPDDCVRTDCLVLIAECFELEADSQSSISSMVANSFYEQSLQAYRRIPTKHREKHGIEEKIIIIREKITKAGKSTLDEMGLLRTPGIDTSGIVQSSVAHVKDKQSFEDALMYFAGLYPGPNHTALKAAAKDSIQRNIFSSLATAVQMSDDGRVTAKIPSANLFSSIDDPENKNVIEAKAHQFFSHEIQLIVKSRILPALMQILAEHRATKDLLIDICRLSPIVPDNRVNLLGFALWLGFESDFGNAIHLLCPQVENIVRIQLKGAGAHTSNVDIEGIENENGLSTLMDLPESLQVFGEHLAFEIKHLFTEVLGSNLRNEVAHGLLDDDTSGSFPAIYAWWMVLRMVVRSIIYGPEHLSGQVGLTQD